jgi:hypothetical protein
MLGYLLPPWADSSAPGVFATTCYDDVNTDKDPKGHQHKLETEGIGPTGSGLVAEHLTALLAQDSDVNARVATGRYVAADGSLSRRPEGAVGIVLLDGTVVALPSVRSFGATPPDGHGSFVDYDGEAQAAPDLITTGMQVTDGSRLYLDVYPDVDIKALGPAVLAASTAAPPGPAAAQAARRRGLPPTGGDGPMPPVWIASLLAAAMLVRKGVRRAR